MIIEAILFLAAILLQTGSNQKAYAYAMPHSGSPGEISADTDCTIRQLAWEYGKHLKPERGDFKSLFDALQLSYCNLTTPTTEDSWQPPSTPSLSNTILYVDPTSTAPDPDPQTGSITAPFSTLEAAVGRSRTLIKPVDILLRAGTYYLTSTIELGPKDSGLRIANYPDEEAIVSGGFPVEPQWKDASTVCGQGCFVAYLPSVDTLPGFRRDGVREIRARYPNFDEELDMVFYFIVFLSLDLFFYGIHLL